VRVVCRMVCIVLFGVVMLLVLNVCVSCFWWLCLVIMVMCFVLVRWCNVSIVNRLIVFVLEMRMFFLVGIWVCCVSWMVYVSGLISIVCLLESVLGIVWSCEWCMVRCLF